MIQWLKETMDELLTLVRQVDRFWFEPQSIAPLVVARIGLGLAMFFAYLLYAPFIDTIFGPESLGAYILGRDFIIREHTWFYYWLTLSSAACFTVGLATPLSGITLILCHLTFIEPGRFFSYGWVPTAPAFIWYLAIGPCGRRYSVDAWLSKNLFGHQFKRSAPGWSMRLIQMHIIAVYIGASWHRIDDAAWWRGEMVYDAVQHSYYSRFPNVDWQSYKTILVPMNYFVWFLELAAPIGLVFRPTRIWFGLGLWAMHFGLELTSNIGWWQFMMMSVLFTFFPIRWSERLLRVGREPSSS